MTECTLTEAANDYIEFLKTQGKTERTVYTYGKDLDQIKAFFGEDRKLKSILIPHVGKFLKSDALLKLPNGNERAKPTKDKIVRVLRMFLIWAKDTGRIDTLPLTKDTPMGRSLKNTKTAVADNSEKPAETPHEEEQDDAPTSD